MSLECYLVVLPVDAATFHAIFDPHALVGVALTLADGVPCHRSKALPLVVDPGAALVCFVGDTASLRVHSQEP